MGTATQNLKDVLSLARMLRRVADRFSNEPVQNQLLSTANELESHALVFANTRQPFAADLEREVTLHAPVNLVI